MDPAMDKGWLFLIVLGLTVVLGLMLRGRLSDPDAAFRKWAEANFGPLARRLVKVLFYVTVAAWLVIWATADDDARTRLGRDFQSFMKSIEWGQQKDETTDEAPASPTDAPPAEPKP
jgi:hypothetical protein